jgi:hypothetical protein
MLRAVLLDRNKEFISQNCTSLYHAHEHPLILAANQTQNAQRIPEQKTKNECLKNSPKTSFIQPATVDQTHELTETGTISSGHNLASFMKIHDPIVFETTYNENIPIQQLNCLTDNPNKQSRTNDSK